MKCNSDTGLQKHTAQTGYIAPWVVTGRSLTSQAKLHNEEFTQRRSSLNHNANSTSSGYRSKLLTYTKTRAGCVLFFFIYLWLLRHARSPTMPGTPVSPLCSTATVMNYANPLVFVQCTMTQGCKQLTPGIKKSQPLCLSQKRITLTAATSGKLLLNKTRLTAEVKSGGE